MLQHNKVISIMSFHISYKLMKELVSLLLLYFCCVYSELYNILTYAWCAELAVYCEWTSRGSLETGTARTASTSTSAAVTTASAAVNHGRTCNSVTAIALVVCWPPSTSARATGTAAAATITLPAAAAASSAALSSGTSQQGKVQLVLRVTLLVAVTAPQFVLGGKLATGYAQGDLQLFWFQV